MTHIFSQEPISKKDIYYTIYRWWEKLIEGDVEFIDITNGDGTVYVARDN